MHDRFLAVGKVVKVHGIRGEVKILIYSQDFHQFVQYLKLYTLEESKINSWHVKKVRRQGRCALVLFDGLSSRDEAQRLVGLEVFVDKRDLPPLEDDEYYWYQLKGLKVVTTSGEHLGVITDIFDNGAHDIYVVSHGTREILIPAVESIIVDISLEKQLIVVDPPLGLIEANDI